MVYASFNPSPAEEEQLVGPFMHITDHQGGVSDDRAHFHKRRHVPNFTNVIAEEETSLAPASFSHLPLTSSMKSLVTAPQAFAPSNSISVLNAVASSSTPVEFNISWSLFVIAFLLILLLIVYYIVDASYYENLRLPKIDISKMRIEGVRSII